MDPVELLNRARGEGVELDLVNGDLVLEAPRSKSSLVQELHSRKAEIIAHLRGETLEDESAVTVSIAWKYKAFPAQILPRAIKEYVMSASRAIGCDPSFIALPLLCCLARSIGNNRVIRLKKGWTEPPVIWAAIIGKSGTYKTPALQLATAPLERKQNQAMNNFSEAQEKHAIEQAQYERDLQIWRRSKDNGPPPRKPREPTCTRYLTSDCTIEALAALLSVQKDGILVCRDELAGWLGGIAEYKGGRGSDLGHWLSCWSAAPFTVDRKTGPIKVIRVPRAAVSLVGGIQPDILRRAIGREHMQDGLCARLLLAMPNVGDVVWTEETVNPQMESELETIFDRLSSLEPAADENGQSEPYPLDLTPEARVTWIEYFNRHRGELRELDDDLAAAWTKLEAYTARLALIFQLCSWATDEAQGDSIDENSINAAIVLSDWFGGEAKRVYGLLAESEECREQQELVQWIARSGGSITNRELAHRRARYRHPGAAAEALESLVKAGHGKFEVIRIDGRGRPSRRFVLSPVTVTHSSDTKGIANSVTVTNGQDDHQGLRNGNSVDLPNRLSGESHDGLG